MPVWEKHTGATGVDECGKKWLERTGGKPEDLARLIAGDETKAEVRGHLAICKTCENRVKSGTCKHCGWLCALAQNAPLTKLSDCPAGKWNGHVESQLENMRVCRRCPRLALGGELKPDVCAVAGENILRMKRCPLKAWGK